MIGARNVKGGLVLVFLGLMGGMAMSLYAFEPIVRPPAALENYDDLPRRLLRLAHIAAVMLPLMNVVAGLVLDRLNLRSSTKQAVSWTLLVSSAALPLSLAAEAWWAPLRSLHLPGVPAAAFTLAVGALAIGACRTDFGMRDAELSPGAGRTLDADGVLRGGSRARWGLGGGALEGALFEINRDEARERDE